MVDRTLPDVREAASTATSEPPTDVIDPARFVRGDEIARGGMGRVIAACDRKLDRPIALKELLASGADAIRRFTREARITARLQHPAIVHIYEAGVWPDGAPFYAMNHVRGRSLAAALAASTTLAERLALLRHVRAIADALAYAHAQGVVHRDIKPANVIVGEFGETVVIDWGLAKQLADPGATADEAVGETTADHTGVVGTPRYMAPEQARGEAVDARVDVYSVGALLYHLLAGKPPYGESASEHVIASVLAGAPRPLRAIAPDAPVDLAAIVDKAMARDPQDRYANASELAADLQRFETGQLVAARRYSWRQRVARVLRRHSIIVAMAAALLVVGAISIVRVMNESARARAEAARADQRLAEVRALTTSLLFEVDESVRDIAGATRTREIVVRRAVDYLDRLASEAGDRALLGELAIAYMKTGDILGNSYVPNLGRVGEALASYRKADQLLTILEITQPTDQVATLRVEQLVGNALVYATDDRHRARALVEHALAHAARTSATADRITLARGHYLLMTVARDDGRLADAVTIAGSMLAQLDRWPPDEQQRYWRGLLLGTRAEVEIHLGDVAIAERDAQQSLEILEALAASYPNNQAYASEPSYPHYLLAIVYSGFESGRIWLANHKDLARAEHHRRRGVEIGSRNYAMDRNDARARFRLATQVGELALTIAERSPSESRATFEQAAELFDGLDATTRNLTNTRENEFLTRCGYAAVLAQLGDRDGARRQAGLGLTLASDQPVSRAMCQRLLASMERALGDPRAARARLDDAEAVLRTRDDVVSRLGLTDIATVRATLQP